MGIKILHKRFVKHLILWWQNFIILLTTFFFDLFQCVPVYSCSLHIFGEIKKKNLRCKLHWFQYIHFTKNLCISDSLNASTDISLQQMIHLVRSKLLFSSLTGLLQKIEFLMFISADGIGCLIFLGISNIIFLISNNFS